MISPRRNPFLAFEGEWFARSRSAAWIASIYPALVVAASAAVLLVWTPGPSVKELENHGWRWIFLAALLVSQAVFLALLGPLEGVTRAFRERRRGNFELIVVSPAHPGQLLAGLAVGAVLPVLFLVLTTLPPALLVLRVGNLSASVLFADYALLTLLGAATAMVGIAAALHLSTAAEAWQVGMTASGLLLLGGPMGDLLSFLVPRAGQDLVRVAYLLLVAGIPVGWAAVVSFRVKGIWKAAPAIGAMMIVTACGFVLGAGRNDASLSLLSPVAVFLGEGFERMTTLDMPRAAPLPGILFLAGLLLVASASSLVRVEKLLGRRVFHRL